MSWETIDPKKRKKLCSAIAILISIIIISMDYLGGEEGGGGWLADQNYRHQNNIVVSIYADIYYY